MGVAAPEAAAEGEAETAAMTGEAEAAAAMDAEIVAGGVAILDLEVILPLEPPLSFREELIQLAPAVLLFKCTLV